MAELINKEQPRLQQDLYRLEEVVRRYQLATDRISRARKRIVGEAPEPPSETADRDIPFGLAPAMEMFLDDLEAIMANLAAEADMLEGLV